MHVREDEVVNAIRWRLGIPVDGNDARAREIWERLRASADPGVRAQLDRVSRFLADALERTVRCRLGLPEARPADDRDFLDSLWESFAAWLRADPMKRSPRVNGLLRDAVAGKPASVRLDALPASPPASAPARTPASGVRPPPPSVPAPVPKPPPLPKAAPAPSATSDAEPAAESRSRPPASQWIYRPVPDHEPDVHQESYCESRRAHAGEPVLGARVRGKKHKHEGTNCDDWFEVRMGGPWTVIAVADGAGSRKFSRVGARASCVRAAETLAAELTPHAIPDRPDGYDLTGKDDQGWDFRDPVVELVQRSMHRAIRAAAAAVEEEARARASSPAHERLLGRAVTAEDLAATFLLAAHTTAKIGDRVHHLTVGCQIGDGIIAVVQPSGAVCLLGRPDSGDYSGETDFLTSRRQLESANLERKTFALAGPLRVLLVMTDGVADDYFPAEAGMARLHADLVLNGILSPCAPALADLAKEPMPVQEDSPLPADPDPARSNCEAEVPTADGPVRVLLRSAALYAAERGVPVERLAAEPAWLRAGARDTPLAQCPENPEERLRRWLDAYQVRGSFDDRTLVVLHCERPS